MLTAVFIGILLGCDFKLAAHWLMSKRRHRHRAAPPLPEDSLQRAIEDKFLTMPLETAVALEQQETSPLNPIEYDKAVAWARSRQLAGWVRQKNTADGTPVRTEAMAIKMHQLHAAGIRNHFAAPPLELPNSIKCWGYRWRQQHGAKISCLRKSEPLVPEEALEKAFTTH